LLCRHPEQLVDDAVLGEDITLGDSFKLAFVAKLVRDSFTLVRSEADLAQDISVRPAQGLHGAS
jgi:hypothetical protein